MVVIIDESKIRLQPKMVESGILQFFKAKQHRIHRCSRSDRICPRRNFPFNTAAKENEIIKSKSTEISTSWYKHFVDLWVEKLNENLFNYLWRYRLNSSLYNFLFSNLMDLPLFSLLFRSSPENLPSSSPSSLSPLLPLASSCSSQSSHLSAGRNESGFVRHSSSNVCFDFRVLNRWAKRPTGFFNLWPWWITFA